MEFRPITNFTDCLNKTLNYNHMHIMKVENIKKSSYKSLSWREKDRRRKFRDEWKKTWLVIPNGKYGVMCLLCHKIMTQRKLDTIKRHAIRRHSKLLDLNVSEKNKLFEEIIQNWTCLDENLKTPININRKEYQNYRNLIPFNESFLYFLQKNLYIHIITEYMYYNYNILKFHESLNKNDKQKLQFSIENLCSENNKISSTSKSLLTKQILKLNPLSKDFPSGYV